MRDNNKNESLLELRLPVIEEAVMEVQGYTTYNEYKQIQELELMFEDVKRIGE